MSVERTMEERVQELESVMHAVMEQQIMLSVLTDFLAKRLFEEGTITDEQWDAYKEKAQEEFTNELELPTQDEAINEIEF